MINFIGHSSFWITATAELLISPLSFIGDMCSPPHTHITPIYLELQTNKQKPFIYDTYLERWMKDTYQKTSQNWILCMLVVKLLLTILSLTICLYLYAYETLSHCITPTLFKYSAIHPYPISHALAFLSPAKQCLRVIIKRA